MATDYDAPRRSAEDDDTDAGVAQLAGAAAKGRSGVVEDEATIDEDLELPGADLSGEALTVRVVPQQVDEFTCSRCFLVAHVSQRASTDPDICRDCA